MRFDLLKRREVISLLGGVIQAEEELKALQRHALAIVGPENG
jgi:hypothetical protein